MNEFTERELFLIDEALKAGHFGVFTGWLDEVACDNGSTVGQSLLADADRLHPVAETAKEKAYKEALITIKEDLEKGFLHCAPLTSQIAIIEGVLDDRETKGARRMNIECPVCKKEIEPEYEDLPAMAIDTNEYECRHCESTLALSYYVEPEFRGVIHNTLTEEQGE